MDANLAAEQFVHRAGVGDLQQLGALLVIEGAEQFDPAPDVVAAVRLAGRVELQFDPYFVERPLPARRHHLDGDCRAGAEAGQYQAFRRWSGIAAAGFERLVGRPGVTLVVGQFEAGDQRVAQQQERSQANMTLEQCREMGRIVAERKKRFDSMTAGEKGDFERFQANFGERCRGL